MRQSSTTRRRLTACAFLVVAGFMTLGSVAYACVPLATLHANPISAAPGSTVTLFGKYYSGGGSTAAAGAGPIEVHLDSRTGPVIATFPAGAREISGSWTIPADMAAGEYTLIATQYTPAGIPVSGTPGRATVLVNRPLGRTGDEPPAGAAAGTSSAPAAATSSAPAAANSSGLPADTSATPAPPRSDAVPAGSAPPAANAAASPRTGAESLPVAEPGAAPTAADVAPSPVGAAAASASPPLGAPEAAAGSSNAPVDATALDVRLRQPSSQSSSALPRATLVAGLALVLLGLGAALKSGRTIVGGRRVNPLAS